MSKSLNAKQSEITKRIGGNRKNRKTKGQSGTHRLKQLGVKRGHNGVIAPQEPVKRSWLSRLFKSRTS